MWKQSHESDEEFAAGSQAYRIWNPLFQTFSTVVESPNELEHRASWCSEREVWQKALGCLVLPSEHVTSSVRDRMAARGGDI